MTTVASAHNVAANVDRAVELYNAMQKNFYQPDSKLYLETRPQRNGNQYAYLWPFYEAMAGTVDLAGIPSVGTNYTGPSGAVQGRLSALKVYYRGWNAASITYDRSGYDSYPRSPYGAGGDRYNDDNAWIGRTFIQVHRLFGDTYRLAGGLTPLQGAVDIFQFLQASWHASPPYPSYPNAGGVFWIRSDWDRRPDRDRGTGATGGYAKLALHLHTLTGDTSYLAAARQAYDWTRMNLYRTDNVYADKILPDGTTDWGVWSYNQGVMVGAGVLMYRATNDAAFLQQAVTTADASIAYFNTFGWYHQPVIFNALFFRNLLLLYAVSPSSYARFRQAAQDFANKVWTDKSVHNMQSHLIRFDPTTSVFKLREQAGMVQIFASLAWADAGNNLALLS
jgi:Glycosyl hydrolase family 76